MKKTFKSFIISTFILLVFLSSRPVYATCILQSEDPTGCAYNGTLPRGCGGSIWERNPTNDSTCLSRPGELAYKSYRCWCNWTGDFYLCPAGGGARWANVVYNSSYTATYDECSPFDMTRYSVITKVQGTNSAACGAWCRGSITVPPVTPSPVILQNSIKVQGSVKDLRFGTGLAGSRILVHMVDNKYGPCQGTHFGCSPEYVYTDKSGNWTSTCTSRVITKSILVKEVQNPGGYVDANYGPNTTGASIWDRNTVCFENLIGKYVLGPLSFYDLKK